MDSAYRISFTQPLALKFFLEFSRSEYSLKRAGFLVKGSDDAKPDWDTFATAITTAFEAIREPALNEARAFLVQAPPRRQVNRAGSLDWDDIPQAVGESSTRYLLRLVRHVRNNLFHGGKYPDGPVFDLVRNDLLLTHSLTLLHYARGCSPSVTAFFAEAA